MGSFKCSDWPQAHSFVHPQHRTLSVSVGPRDWLTTLHLSTFSKHLHSSSQVHCPNTEFERLCSLSETPRHLLSTIYSLLQALTHGDLPAYTRMGTADLGEDISRLEWQTSFHFTHKSTISCYSQEKNYKILSRWYRDPATLHKFSHPLRPPVGSATPLQEPISMSGGNVKGSAPSGPRYLNATVKFMINHYCLPLRLPSFLSSLGRCCPRSGVCSIFLCPQRDSSSHPSGKLPPLLLCPAGSRL